MKLKSVEYDDQGDEIFISTLTVEMTQAEAAAITRLFGAMNSIATRKLGLMDDGNGIYNTLTWMFNSAYENGVEEVLRYSPSKDLDALNERTTA